MNKKVIVVSAFTVVFLGLLVLHHVNGANTPSGINGDEQSANNVETSINLYENTDSTDSTPIIEDFHLSDSIIELCKPAPINDRAEQIIRKNVYVVSYNKDTRIANWVAWHLTSEHTDGPYKRNNIFYEDTVVPYPRATSLDYRGSGWSRGHMCPAGDNKWNETAMIESFSLINVCPQNANLNSGLWNSIEIDCRNWARRFNDIYIVCGPLFLNKEHDKIGDNKVFVPEAFFKVILCLNGKPKGMGIIVRNTDGNKKRDLYYNSIDQVERITGYDFFPALPDDVENEVEAYANIDDWSSSMSQ